MCLHGFVYHPIFSVELSAQLFRVRNTRIVGHNGSHSLPAAACRQSIPSCSCKLLPLMKPLELTQVRSLEISPCRPQEQERTRTCLSCATMASTVATRRQKLSSFTTQHPGSNVAQSCQRTWLQGDVCGRKARTKDAVR